MPELVGTPGLCQGAGFAGLGGGFGLPAIVSPPRNLNDPGRDGEEE